MSDKLNILRMSDLEFELISHSTKIVIGFDKKDMYTYICPICVGNVKRHMSDIRMFFFVLFFSL